MRHGRVIICRLPVKQSVEGLHPATKILWFSGPGEGWARYSEGLAEEMGLYETTTGPIRRLAWPARGMVVDPGIHLFGWTREEAIDFMMESGRFADERGDEMVDRIAMLPGPADGIRLRWTGDTGITKAGAGSTWARILTFGSFMTGFWRTAQFLLCNCGITLRPG